MLAPAWAKVEASVAPRCTAKAEQIRRLMAAVRAALPEFRRAEALAYWVIESRRHHCLDITLREDQSRVRNPTAARVLGTIRRAVVSLAHAAVDQARRKNPKTKCNTGSFQQRFRSACGGRERLQALIFAKSPNVLD